MTASTVSEWPRLTGRQEPHFLSEWPGDETEGEQAAKQLKQSMGADAEFPESKTTSNQSSDRSA